MKPESKEYSSNYGERLLKIRDVLEISQKMFAKNIGVAPSVLSELEREVTKPGYIFLRKLSQIYGINPSYVLLGHGEMFLAPKKTPDLNQFDFGEQNEKIRDLLIYCQKSPLVRLAVIAHFTKYLLDNETVIERDIDRHDAQKI